MGFLDKKILERDFLRALKDEVSIPKFLMVWIGF